MTATRINELRSRFPSLTVKENEPMRAHTSFRIGGPADLFLEPADALQAADLIRFLRETGEPFEVIGNGTNLLVRDEGYRGTVVHFGEPFAKFRAVGEIVYADAGVSLSRLAVFAKEQGLAGLEFAHGIPGSLGGAVLMNAGAYGGEMKDIVSAVRYLSADGWAEETEDGAFGYRTSRFAKSGEIVLGAAMRLHRDAPDAIQARMTELWTKRSASQPLDRPSAGSTFKRPATGYAAALIDESGLRGVSVGGAQVSEKHAGFVINSTGKATFADVIALMELIQKRVFERSGVRLEPEVRVLGGTPEGEQP